MVNRDEAPTAFHFDRVSLTNCPPIGSLDIVFSDGINLVTGSNGAGKTSLAKALCSGEWPKGSGEQSTVSIIGRGDFRVLERYRTYTLINDNIATDSERPQDDWTRLAQSRPELLKLVSSSLAFSLRHKLGADGTRFARIPYCGPETFDLTFSEYGDIRVNAGPALLEVPHVRGYDCVGVFFQAFGEKFLVNLCGLLCARDLLGIRTPLILDVDLGGLDSFLQKGFEEMIAAQNAQTVIFLRDDKASVDPFLEYGQLVARLPTRRA